MWIQGVGNHSCCLVNTDQVRYFFIDDNGMLIAYNSEGSGIYLMKFEKKEDGPSMINKIGYCIASGREYVSLEDLLTYDNNSNDHHHQ